MARIGGDEFVMVLPRVALADAVIRGERIRSRLAGLKTESRNVTTSIGVAELLSGEEYDALFHRADDALYRAKAKGRNNVAAAQGSSTLSG